MSKAGEAGVRSWIARLTLTYLEKVPAHRGKSRLIRILGQRLGPVPVRCAGGARLLLRLDSSMDRSYVSRSRLNHSELLAELARLKPGEIFVDVGANAGLYAIMAANAVRPTGRVYAFEPSQDEFYRLAWAVAANRAMNVQAFNFALSDSNNYVGFVRSPSNHTGLHHLSTAEPDNHETAHHVWAQRGDVAIALRNDESIALLKIDVEGAELLALRGFDEFLRTGRIQRIVVEITDAFLRRFGNSAEELYAYLSGLGYQPSKGLSGEWQYDEVFVRNH